SVLGALSTVPFLSTTTLTASKMLSEIGSSMSRISSLTETTGFMSPQSSVVGRGPGTGFDDEHACVKTATTSNPMHAAKHLPMRSPNISPPEDGRPVRHCWRAKPFSRMAGGGGQEYTPIHWPRGQ